MQFLKSRIRLWIQCSIICRSIGLLTVEIETFGQLLPGQPRRRTLEIQGPATARDIALSIGLDLTEIGIVSIDGVQSELDAPVPHRSSICFFPYLSGG